MFESSDIRKGQPDTQLSEMEFKAAFQRNFFDPRFHSLQPEIDRLAEVAWRNYCDGRKAPLTVKAGSGFQDPNYDLSVEWLKTSERLKNAERARQVGASRILIVNGSPRSEHTCPGEISKTYRLVKMAEDVVRAHEMQADILDLSLLTAEYGKKIYPCKACVSTAMPLCHWPCSCYPNHSLAQASDWMAEIYEKWTAAHGVMIITPVHWYQAPSVLKLMMDRLVCADGGNPDPTRTHGKDPKLAKKIELEGWDYPKHLAGRAFSVVVHGDAAGVETLRRSLCDWLTDIQLVQAGRNAIAESYVGYYRPYATSHRDLDESKDFIQEVQNAALSLVHQVELMRSGEYHSADDGLESPSQK